MLRKTVLFIALIFIATCCSASAKAVVSDNQTMFELLDEIGVEYTEDSSIYVVSHVDTSGINSHLGLNSLGNMKIVETSEIIVKNVIGDQIFQENIQLLDEGKREADILVAIPTTASVTLTNTSSESIIITEIAGWNPIYNDNTYKYVVTCGSTYTIAQALNNQAINLYCPTSYFVRASSYSTTTHSISNIRYGITLQGIVFNSSREMTQDIGYFYHDATAYNIISGHTYTTDCSAAYYNDYGNDYIGCIDAYGQISVFLVGYTITFDDNTRFEYSYFIDQ